MDLQALVDIVLSCYPLQIMMVTIMTPLMSTNLCWWGTAPLLKGCAVVATFQSFLSGSVQELASAP